MEEDRDSSLKQLDGEWWSVAVLRYW